MTTQTIGIMLLCACFIGCTPEQQDATATATPTPRPVTQTDNVNRVIADMERTLQTVRDEKAKAQREAEPAVKAALLQAAAAATPTKYDENLCCDDWGKEPPASDNDEDDNL